jgi:hypothetical protein
LAYPDLWRYNEWKREFDLYVENGKLPSLSIVRIPHDHMGSFGSAHGGVNTPETLQADNDPAVGKMVEAVANSPYANDTLIFVIEDDCQDGPDHVDSHRTTTYVVGPYVRKEAVISAPYTQVHVLRTIEDILGIFQRNSQHRSQARGIARLGSRTQVLRSRHQWRDLLLSGPDAGGRLGESLYEARL